jgi:hypothetical protein
LLNLGVSDGDFWFLSSWKVFFGYLDNGIFYLQLNGTLGGRLGSFLDKRYVMVL